MCCLGKWDSDLAKCHIPKSAILKQIQFIHFTSTENTDWAKVMYLHIHHLSLGYIMWKEWDMMPNRNFPLKLISQLLKILIKRMHTGRAASINPVPHLYANNGSQAMTTAALNTCQKVTLMWLCFLSRRGLEDIIWIICREQISCFAAQASVHGWTV